MLARAHTFTIEGLHTRRVAVEVDIRPGLPAFTIVGLADTAVREARERIKAAILNSGYEFPARRVTANLAPGDVPKAGAGLDLALACSVLVASGQLPADGSSGSHCSASLPSTAPSGPRAGPWRSRRRPSELASDGWRSPMRAPARPD